MKVLLLLSTVASCILVANARPLFMDTLLSLVGIGGGGGGYPGGGGGYPIGGGGYPIGGGGYPIGGGGGSVPAASNCIPYLCQQRCNAQGFYHGAYCAYNQCQCQIGFGG